MGGVFMPGIVHGGCGRAQYGRKHGMLGVRMESTAAIQSVGHDIESMR